MALDSDNRTICLFDSIKGTQIPTQMNLNLFPEIETNVEFEMNFKIEILPMSYTKLYAKKCQNDEFYEFIKQNTTFNVSNSYFDYSFSKDGLSKIFDKERNKLIPLSQEFFYYEVSRGGKYIFVPGDRKIIKNDKLGVEQFIIRGSLMTIIHQRFDYYAQQIIKIFNDKKYSEIEIRIGHPFGIIPNTEVATKFIHSGFQNNKFYVDSNGLEIHERQPVK